MACASAPPPSGRVDSYLRTFLALAASKLLRACVRKVLNMRVNAKYLVFTLILAIFALGITAYPAPRPVKVRAGFVYVPRPYFYRPYYYDPFWYGPGWYAPPAYAVPGYAHGTVKTEIEPRSAEVFVNGGYAGTADKFRGAFHGLDLRPGNYDLEIRAPHYQPLRIKVYVAANKTLKLKERLLPD